MAEYLTVHNKRPRKPPRTAREANRTRMPARPVGRPVSYPNGRTCLHAMFDVKEAEVVRLFCLEQLLDISRFIRAATLKLLKEQGVDVKTYAVDMDVRHSGWPHIQREKRIRREREEKRRQQG